MNKEELENILSYNNHAVTMSRIAVSLLAGENPLNLRGVREILAMYLLVPYITNSQLDKPDELYNIPKLDINSLFTKVIYKDGSLKEMTLDNLRNAICHSFIALTEKETYYWMTEPHVIERLMTDWMIKDFVTGWNWRKPETNC